MGRSRSGEEYNIGQEGRQGGQRNRHIINTTQVLQKKKTRSTYIRMHITVVYNRHTHNILDYYQRTIFVVLLMSLPILSHTTTSTWKYIHTHTHTHRHTHIHYNYVCVGYMHHKQTTDMRLVFVCGGGGGGGGGRRDSGGMGLLQSSLTCCRVEEKGAK